MNDILYACGEITWQNTNLPPEQVLEEIALAGYDGATVKFPSVVETREVYGRFGLKSAPRYLGAELWDAKQRDEILSRAAEMARTVQELGCSELYVAASLTPDRRAVAGHVSAQDALDDGAMKTVADTLNRIGEITLEHGVSSCFHNHVGSFIETREEIDKLFALVDKSLVFHGPDIGHLAWAGGDVVSYCRDYGPNIKTLHVKDLDREVLERGVNQQWDYATFSDQGIFTELGEGFVDFPTIFNLLEDVGFCGWVVVETDVTQKPTALESATISREYLRRLAM